MFEEAQVSHTNDDNIKVFSLHYQIDNAFEAGNLHQLDQLCATALNDPSLPVLFRAKYEVYISLCPGRDPDHHLTNAEKMFERVQKTVDEGGASDFALGMLAALKGSRDVIRANMVKVELETGEVVHEDDVGEDRTEAVKDAGSVKLKGSAVPEKDQD